MMLSGLPEAHRYVTELRPCDVLFGRGSGPNDHEGNIRFRQLVAERKSEYMATNHRMTKAKIAKEIVDQVFAVNGRFVKKVEPDELKDLGLPEGTDLWEIVGDDTIMEKAKQALRQNTQKEKGKISPKPMRPISMPGTVSNHNSPVPPQRGVQHQRSMDLADLEPFPFVARRGYSRTERAAAVDSESPAVPLVVDSYQPNMGAPQHVATSSWRGDSSPINVSASWRDDRDVPRIRNVYPSRQPDIVRSHGPAGVVDDDDDDGGVPDSDSMLAYVRLRTDTAAQSFASNLSMSQIPQDDGPINDRRGSITLMDLKRLHGRRHLLDMGEMTDSFNRMSTSEERRMHTSVETMGTIEPIGAGSVADMSIATMGSSTFSFFRGNDSMADAALDERIAQVEAQVDAERAAQQQPNYRMPPPLDYPQQLREPSHTSLGSAGPGFLTSHASMSLSDVWGSRRRSTNSSGTNVSSLLGSKDSLPTDFSMQNMNAYQPRPIALLEEEPSHFDSYDELGASSLSILKSSFTVNEINVPDPDINPYSQFGSNMGNNSAPPNQSYCPDPSPIGYSNNTGRGC